MIVTLQLPDKTAERARLAGLFDPARAAQLFEEKLAEEGDSRTFFEMARDIRSVDGAPLTLEQIQAEVDVVRAERAARDF